MPPNPTLRRGERNNNPFNIEINPANDWVGKVKGSDGRFEYFSKPIYGIRAGIILIYNYKKKYGLNTIDGIINRFAPPNENNTEQYKEFVSDETGIGIYEIFPFKENMTSLVKAIITMEQGRCIYSDALIQEAHELALSR